MKIVRLEMDNVCTMLSDTVRPSPTGADRVRHRPDCSRSRLFL